MLDTGAGIHEWAERFAKQWIPAFRPDDGLYTPAQSASSTESSYDDVSALHSLAPQQFEGSATREIVTQAGAPNEKRFTGESYLLHYGLPHFFFHVTNAHSILRHNGVEVGKKDYVGTH